MFTFGWGEIFLLIIIVIIFFTDSEIYISCSSNISKIYSISEKLFIKSVSNVFNIPIREKATIIKRKTYPKNPNPSFAL